MVNISTKRDYIIEQSVQGSQRKIKENNINTNKKHNVEVEKCAK